MAMSLKKSEKEVQFDKFKQIPFIWWKIVKISPVYPEIIGLHSKKKIMESTIYSPVGKCAERAK